MIMCGRMLVTIWGLCVFLSGSAQEHNGTYHYAGKFNSSFGTGEQFREYAAKLIVRDSRSLFTMKEEGVHHAGMMDPSIDLTNDSIFTVFKEHESASLLFEYGDLNRRSHFFNDTLFPMVWEMVEEEKTVNGILCRKAVTFFKGRHYIAWYAPSIPISEGPWKLGGLPGLILEAYDEQQHWYMTYVGQTPATDFDTAFFNHMLREGTDNYVAFGQFLKRMFRRLETAFGSSDQQCLDCPAPPKLRFHTWEQIDD